MPGKDAVAGGKGYVTLYFCGVSVAWLMVDYLLSGEGAGSI